MKILHTDFHRGFGGQAARVLMVCRRLADLGHGVLIAAPPGELARRARQAGLEVDDGFSFRPPSRALAFMGDVRRLSRRIREGGFEILHTHGSQDTWVGTAFRMLTGEPALFVATRHNSKRVRFNMANRYLYGRALDHLVLAAGGIQDRFRPFLEAGLLTEERISVVHSAYRSDVFDDGPEPGDARRELGLEERRPLLGVMARLVRDKGHTHLFEAMESVRGKHPRALLLLAGTGPAEESLRREVARRGLDDHVRFLGFRNDIPRITAALDVAVLPSVGCDASSASIKEAMAMGRPVVATDIGGAREIMKDGVTGLVVPPGDPGALASAILFLLEDPRRAAGMGQAARREVRSRFSPERLGDGIAAVYERLLEPAGRAVSAAAPPGAEVRASQGGSRP